MLQFAHGVLTVLGFFALGAAAITLQVIFGQQRVVRALSKYVRSRGYHFENNELARIPDMSTMEMWKTVDFKGMKRDTLGITSIYEFSGPAAAGTGFYLSVLGRKMTVFKFSFSGRYRRSAGGTSTRFYYLRTAKLQCDALPIFRLEHKNIVTKVDNMVNKLLHVDASANALQPLNLAGHRPFSDRYRLTAVNAEETAAFFTDARMAALVQLPAAAIIAACPGYAVYFEHGQFSDEASYDDFIHRAKSGFEALLGQGPL